MSRFKDCLSWCMDQRHHMKYNTVKIVAIKSPTLSIIFRCCQLAVILYILISVIVIKKGYQRFGAVSGTTRIKVKGSAYNAGGLPWLNYTTQPGDLSQVFDSTDLVYPATEKDAAFIATNLYFTSNQTRSVCYPGSDLWFTSQPKNDANANASCAATCQRGTLVGELELRTGGVWTGDYQLKPTLFKNGTTNPATVNCYCQLYTWCPDENIPKNTSASPNAFHLVGIENFTVSFAQNVQFRAFDAFTSNIPPGSSTPPIYTVGQMLAGAGLGIEDIRVSGGIIAMMCEWNCNLDYSLDDDCFPDVSWLNLGNGASYSFRHAEYTSSDGMWGNRQLVKHWGLRIVVIISGNGSAFDAAAFFTNIGAGIGLLAVATLIADFVAVNLLGPKNLYAKAKFKDVEILESGRARGISESTATAPNPALAVNVKDVELHGSAMVPEGAIDSETGEPREREESWGVRKPIPV